MKTFIIVLIVCIIVLIIVLAIKYSLEQSTKDWALVDYFKQRANEVKTKEEIEELHKEFVEKASKVHNEYVRNDLNRIDGYLRGLYKNIKDGN